MKRKTKNVLIIIFSLIVIFGVIFGLAYLVISSDIKNHNICAKVYGDKEGNWLSWKGSLNYEYKDKYFNETHIACCIKEKFIDSDGQINYERCTGVYPKEKKEVGK